MRHSRLAKMMMLMGRGGPTTLNEALLRYCNLAYWPMTDASGNFLDAIHDYDAVPTGTGITRNAVTLPDGDEIPTFDGTGYANPFSEGFASAFNFNSGSLVAIFQLTQDVWQDGTGDLLINLRGVGSKMIYISKIGTGSGGLSAYRTSNAFYDSGGRTSINLIGLTWKYPGSLKLYAYGRLCNTIADQAEMIDTLSTTYTRIGTDYNGSSSKWIGALGKIALSTSVLTDNQMREIWDFVFPSTRTILAIGDSKTANNLWPAYVCNGLEAATSDTWINVRLAVGGYDVGALKAYLTAQLPAYAEEPEYILLNIGTNDARAVTITPEAEFKTNYASCLDQLIAKFPGVPIYCSHVYRSDSAQTITNSGLINGYIDAVIATYATDVYAGPADNVWAENGDAGATYLQADKIHYNLAAQPVAATQWLTVMGI